MLGEVIKLVEKKARGKNYIVQEKKGTEMCICICARFDFRDASLSPYTLTRVREIKIK